MTRVIAYTRQSTGRDGETESTSLSLQAQLDRIRSHCAHNGWEIVGEVADHDLSGEKWDRPGIQELMNRVRAGGIDIVAVFSISRIARKVLHQEMVMDVLTEHGVELVSVTEAGLDNILVRVVHAGMAEQHNVNHRKILRATLEARAKRGLHHGRAPYGYQVRSGGTKGLDVVSEQAETVQALFRRRADGESIDQLCTWLQGSVAPPRGGSFWHARTVSGILRNPVYAGYARYKGVVSGDAAPDHAPPIVDRPLWQQVQRTFVAGHRQRRPSTERRSWLDGLVDHGCGSAMGSYTSSLNGVSGFKCNRATQAQALRCQVRPVSIVDDGLEAAVLRCLERDIGSIEMDPEAIIQARRDALGMATVVKQRERLLKQRAGLVEQVKRAEQMVTTGRRDFVWFDAFDRDAQERLIVIDAELEALSAIPTEDEIEQRVNEIIRLRPTIAMIALNPDAARSVVAALGRVVFDQGIVSIVYAPEYRDLCPAPARSMPQYRKGAGIFEIVDCR